MAPEMGTQGASKLLCATEWPGLKVNSIQSPSAAMTVSGVKVNVPPSPTCTEWMFEAVDAEAVVVDDDSESEAEPY